jgi:hypothetical protein
MKSTFLLFLQFPSDSTPLYLRRQDTLPGGRQPPTGRLYTLSTYNESTFQVIDICLKILESQSMVTLSLE